jgi:hypothetical protein
VATILKQIISFVNVPAGGQATLPHGLNWQGRPVRPDETKPSDSAFSRVLALTDTVNLTVQNNGAVMASCDVLVEAWHTIERAFGPDTTVALPIQPFEAGSGGGAGAGVAASVLVFRPGGVAAGNIYTTWPTLMAALITLDGPRTIEFDDSIVSPCVIPAGGPYDMTDTLWRGLEGRVVGSYIQIANGASFTGLRRFQRNLFIENTNAAVSPVADLANFDMVEILDNVDVYSAAATVPFFSCAGLIAGQVVAFKLDRVATLGFFNPGQVVIGGVPNNAALYLGIGEFSTVYQGTLAGAALATKVHQFVAESARFANPQAAWLGATTWDTYQDQAFRMNPAPGVAPAVAGVAAGTGQFIRLDATAGSITQVLPAIGGTVFASPGRWVLVKETSGLNTVVIDGFGAETINGAANFTIPPGGSALLVSDGVSNWTLTYDPQANLPATAFVFRPGGVANPLQGIFTTWPSLYAALILRDGPKIIEFDGSIVNPCVIPAPTVPGPYDMTDVVWQGVVGAGVYVGIDISDGVSFTKLRCIRNYIYVRNYATVSPCILARWDSVTLENYVDVSSYGAAAPMWTTAGMLNGHTCSFQLHNYSTLQWYGPAGTPVITHPAVGARIYVACWDLAWLTSCISGVVGALITLNRYGIGSQIYAQPLFLGTLSWAQVTSQVFSSNPAYPAVPAVAAVTAQHGQWIRLNATGGVITQPLRRIANVADPVSSGAWTCVVETSGLNSVIVDPAGADTVNGALLYTIPPGRSAMFISDGVSNWTVVVDPSAALSNVFVFRPGGVANPSQNIFTTWASLYAALILRDGPKVIEFDGTFGACQIPAGGPYAMLNVEWRGMPGGTGGARTQVDILDGASFTNLRTFRNIVVGHQCTVTPPVADLGNGDIIEVVDDSDLYSSPGTVAFFRSTGAPGTLVYFHLENSTIGFYNPNIVVIDVPLVHGLYLILGDNSVIWNGVLQGIGTATKFHRFNSPSAQIMEPQAAWLGNTTWENVQDQALRLNPAPGVAPGGAVATPAHGSFIRVDSTAAIITQALPQLAGAAVFDGAGRWCAIKDVATNGLYGVTVDAFGAETINGALTYAIPPGGAALFVADGVSNWTAIGIDMNHVLNRLNTFARAQGTAQVAVVDNVAGIVIDTTLSNTFRIPLGAVAGDTRQLGIPTGMVAGFTYLIEIVQPTAPTAVQALTYDVVWKFPGGVLPVLTGTNDAVDILTAYYDGVAMRCVFQGDLRNP